MTDNKKTISELFSKFIGDATEILEERAEELKAQAEKVKADRPTIRTKVVDGRRFLDASDLLAYIDHPRSNALTLRRTLLSAANR